eukprot:UN10059
MHIKQLSELLISVEVKFYLQTKHQQLIEFTLNYWLRKCHLRIESGVECTFLNNHVLFHRSEQQLIKFDLATLCNILEVHENTFSPNDR